ncbi:MAG: acyl-CoA mutase large subunit family protein [Opitutales bacterium]|nr:acyl-CoA mutase large subunit family protein [Opitutales bacterium]
MKIEERLFSEFKPATYEEWYAEAVKLLKGAPFDKKMYTKTPEGITLKPIYNRADVDFEPSLPGYGDYVRGTKIDGNKVEPWLVSQELSAGTPAEFNKKILSALNKGQTSIEIVLDEASANALDADKSEVCKVGNKGLSISCAEDFKVALKGVETECVEINIHTQSAAADILAALCAANTGKQLKGGIYFDPMSVLASKGKLNRSMKCALDEIAEMAKFCSKNMKNFGVIGIDTMPYSSAGASAVQELAAAMATAVVYIRAMLERGLDINDVAPLVRFRFSSGSNFFMEIAKFRAARTLWAKVVEQFGGNEQARKIKMNARTAIYNKTIFDPYVNMLRTTTEAFAGVIGGADSMTVGAFDEIIRDSDEFSERIARNQQVILAEECNLVDVVDPAGGSHYVEILTKEVAQKTWETFVKIEEQGGMFEALKAGFVQDEIAKVAADRKKMIDGRRNSVVGTNNYANLSEKLLDKGECKCKALFEERSAEVAKLVKDVTVADSSMEALIAAAAQGAGISALQGAVCKCNGSEEVKPLDIRRAVEHFEALRMASMDFKAKNGFAPKIFLATMGPLVQHKIRADFIRGFFEVGGFEVVYPNGFASADEAAKAFADSGCKYAVICSTDDTYPELVPAVTKAIKATKADSIVYMAGIPAADFEASYKEAGLDGAVNIKSNNYETLKAVLTDLGVL